MTFLLKYCNDGGNKIDAIYLLLVIFVSSRLVHAKEPSAGSYRLKKGRNHWQRYCPSVLSLSVRVKLPMHAAGQLMSMDTR